MTISIPPWCSRSEKMSKNENKNLKKTNTSKKKSQKIPVAVATNMQTSTKTTSVRSKEFCFTVSGNSVNYLLLGNSGVFPGYDLNPGNVLLFPWLSQVSRAYEKYRFTSLSFEVVPRNPSTASGCIYAAFDYDWDDTPATSIQELMSNAGAVSSDIWRSFTLNIDCSRLQQDVPWRYVAENPRTTNSQRMVYGGFLMIAIAGTSSTVSFDVMVNYTVELSLPCLHQVAGSGVYTWSGPQVLAATPVKNTLPQLPNINGIATVIAGLNGVPVLGGPGSPAYQLSGSNKGTLSLEAFLATATSEPRSYTTDTLLSAVGYDILGNVLSTDLNTLASSSTPYPAADDVTKWAVTGSTSRQSFSYAIGLLRAALPTLAYIQPYLVSWAGRTLSTVSNVKAKYVDF